MSGVVGSSPELGSMLSQSACSTVLSLSVSLSRINNFKKRKRKHIHGGLFIIYEVMDLREPSIAVF